MIITSAEKVQGLVLLCIQFLNQLNNYYSSADYDYIIVLSIYFVSLYASKSMVYELILFLMVNTR